VNNSLKQNNHKIPAPEPLAITLRAYSQSVDNSPASPKRDRTPEVYSDYAVVFDTETTVDPSQQVRIGTYRVYEGKHLLHQGLFYDPLSINGREMHVINDWAFLRGMEVISVSEFIETVLFKYAYDYRGTVIGFNLPFDISRISINHASAKGSKKYPKMRGGFTFQLTSDSRRPWIQIKYLNRNSSIFRFTHPAKQLTPRGERKKGFRVSAYDGRFIDIKTLASALRSHRGSLEKLSRILKVKTQKYKSDEHGAEITAEYLDYAAADALTTWECYEVLLDEYGRYNLPNTPIHLIKSEAGIGKADLKEMGIRPWRQVQPDFPPELLGIIMTTYYGGRSEVHFRRPIAQVLYCDFLSMYPTVCTLMRLWRWVIADGITWADDTEKTREFLATVTPEVLLKGDAWPNLTTLVQIHPDADILPVRARYADEPQSTIGLNYLTNLEPTWYTLADCVATALLRGKAPQVIQALNFQPGGIQPGLTSINIAGNDQCQVNPLTGDFYRQVIDLRTKVKRQLAAAIKAGAPADEIAALESEQLALKILANATAYGIFVQVNVDDLPEPTEVHIYGAEGKAFKTTSKKRETPGEYFHPILATLITGAARLMLAITERLILDEGLDWVFCDTDSMAIAKPADMEEAEFIKRTKAVLKKFSKLNPYAVKGELLKVEDANFALEKGSKNLHPLLCFAISAKRYVLFNRDADGRPVIRKASAHGLGHLRPPYEERNAPRKIPKPVVPLNDIGIERWQYDLWYKILEAALAGTPDQVQLNYHEALNLPAVSHYSATNPALLKCFDRYNAGNEYRKQVRPFGFLVALHMVNPAHLLSREEYEVGDAEPEQQRRRVLSPFAPFESDPEKSATQAFDRLAGEPIERHLLATYKQALNQYHLHAESKFLNAESTDTGFAQRRHILATGTLYIGKEADKLEEQLYTGLDEDALIDYGPSPESMDQMAARVRNGITAYGQRATARAAGMSLRDVNQASKQGATLRAKVLIKLDRALSKMG
jgi:hypothetical protein